MKLIFIALFASACLLRAETTNDTPVVPDGGAAIQSKMFFTSIKTREATYWGSVWISVPPIEMTCEHLTTKLPEKGERPESIVASTNVVVLMEDANGTIYTNRSDKAVYTFQPRGGVTNETLVLTGSPVMILWGQNTNTANSIIWDFSNETVGGEVVRGVFPDIKNLQRTMKREPMKTTSTNNAPVNAPSPQPSNP